MATTAQKLVIVESPAKAKTIEKFLGKGYHVEASQGHVRDLPKSQLGVDADHDFEMKYITIRGRGNILARIKKEAKNASRVYLATDPDREGEAISWHLAHTLTLDPAKPCRIEFHEITKKAVKDALLKVRQAFHFIRFGCGGPGAKAQILQNVVGAGNDAPTLPENMMRAFRACCTHAAGNCEHLASLRKRSVHGDDSPAFDASFHKHHAQAQARNDAVAVRKVVWQRLGVQRIFAENQTDSSCDFPQEGPVFRRIGHVDAAAQHADGIASRLQRALMHRQINAAGQAADHAHACLAKTAGEHACHFSSIGAGLPRPHQRDHGPFQTVERTCIIQQIRRAVKLGQPAGIALVSLK